MERWRIIYINVDKIFHPPRCIYKDRSSSTGNTGQDIIFILGLIAQTSWVATKLESTNSDQSSCSLEATKKLLDGTKLELEIKDDI